MATESVEGWGREDDGVKKQRERLRRAESSVVDYGLTAWACMQYLILESWGTGPLRVPRS